MDVYRMTQEQFTAALAAKVTPEFVYENAGRIYEAMTEVMGQGCEDSVLREWAFEWASDGLEGVSYSDIYYRWLDAD